MELASGQEIIITKNGFAVAQLVGMNIKKKSLTEQLRGIISPDIDEDAIKTEKMKHVFKQ